MKDRMSNKKITSAAAVILLVCMLFSACVSSVPTKYATETETLPTESASPTESATVTPEATSDTGVAPTFTEETKLPEIKNEKNEKLEITGLTVNMAELAYGVDSDLYFGWKIKSEKRNNKQLAYRIRVSTTLEKAQNGEGDCWDSNVIMSHDLLDIEYEGKKLESATSYYWTVTAWDTDGYTLSNVHRMITGILSEKDWQGEWITMDRPTESDLKLDRAKWIWRSGLGTGTSASGSVPAGDVYFRFTFDVPSDKKVSKAYLVFTADDSAELYFNEKEILLFNEFAGSWRSASVIDLGEYIEIGENTVALKATNTTNGYAGLLGKIFIEYADSTKDEYVTDRTWKTSTVATGDWYKSGISEASWKAPDQYVSYGSSPWNKNVTVSDRSEIMMRKDFEVLGEVSEALIFMSGIGNSFLSINGSKVDDCFFDPCNTQYNKTVLYRAFDITDKISVGDNALGIELGNGFYSEDGGTWNWQNASWKSQPALRLYMVIKYTDGSVETVSSDETWKVSGQSPVKFNSIYYGEFYDASLEKKGWNTPEYNVFDWKNAVLGGKPEGKLECQLMEPVRRVEAFEALKITKNSSGDYIIECPEMVTGWMKLKINEPNAGELISIRYAEKLLNSEKIEEIGGENGTYSAWFPEMAIMTDRYRARGDEVEYFEPKYSYKGFKYIQISNYPGTLTSDDIEIYRIRSDVDTVGSFESSNELLNKMHSAMLVTVLNNLQGKPTDTPVYEKNGWLGDFNVAALSMMYNYDLRLMTESFVEMMEDCFEQYGLVPPMVPTAGWRIENEYVWSTVYVFAVAEMARQYGASSYLEEQYDTMVKYADGAAADISKTGWIKANTWLGDWVSPLGPNEDSPGLAEASEGSTLVATAYIYMMLDELCDIAELFGDKETVSRLEGYMESIYTAFNKKFYKSAQGAYDTGSWTDYGGARTKYRQTSQLIALAAGLVPEKNVEKVVNNLIKDIEEKGNHLDTGIVGTRYILPVLSDLGYGELAYKIATQTTYPSWGYMVEDSTSLWEYWESTTRSENHYFLGTYEEWFYSHLAGIRNIENGYEKFTVAPSVLGDLTHVTCSIETVRGRVESSWSKADDGTVTMVVEIPFSSEAEIIFPLSGNVTVNGEAVTGESITLGSGMYAIICSK